MSHFTTIETTIKDITALRNACKEMALSLEENAKARGYGNQQLESDYVIRLHGPYDVALVKTENGDYDILADLWHGHVEKEVGKDFGKLKQIYGVHKTIVEARQRGLSVDRSLRQDGSIRLTLCQAC
jgi:hypothetical protein